MSRDIFDYYSIIVDVNLELRGFIEFTKSSLSLHLYSFTHIYPIYLSIKYSYLSSQPVQCTYTVDFFHIRDSW